MEKGVSKEKIKRSAEKVSYELGKWNSPNYLRFLKVLRKAIIASQCSRKRIMVVLSGSDQERVALLTSKLLIYYEEVLRENWLKKSRLDFLYPFYDSFEESKLKKEAVKKAVKERGGRLRLIVIRIEDSRKLMGETYQGVIIDLFNDLRPNYIGILTGLVEGGGLIIVQVPPWNEWDTALTKFKKNLVTYGYERPRDVFIRWFKAKLIKHKENIFIYDADNDRAISIGEIKACEGHSQKGVEIPRDVVFPKDLYGLALTNDQVNAIREIEWLKERSDKKKVLVITADRGRGKSCALGIGIAGLCRLLSEKKRVKIVITSPNLENAQSLMKLANESMKVLGFDVKTLETSQGLIKSILSPECNIIYREPRVAVNEPADILAVDEASGLPVPILYKLWLSHRRLMIATTIHGYEGAGRGFSVRFLGSIKNNPDTILKMVDMSEPIRYASDDPVEKWVFDALLLDAEIAQLDEQDKRDIEAGNLNYVAYDPEHLFFHDEDILRQIFGIYIQAHYRNEPDDVALIADAPHYAIRAVSTKNGKIVSAALVAEEGGLSEEFSKSLLLEDKTKGNIIPDRIIKHYRLHAFGTLRGWRIVRIATHPEIQSKGIGSFLISNIYNEAVNKYDWIGSGFGVNKRLLNFWRKNGFVVVHISPDRNPVSGEYTILVLKSISERSIKMQELIAKVFKEKLLDSLYDTYRSMEDETAIALLESLSLQTPIIPLTPLEKQRLWAYLYGTMTYETTNDIIYRVVKNYVERLPLGSDLLDYNEKRIIVLKVMQGRNWKDVIRELMVSKERCELILKNSIRKIARSFYDIGEHSFSYVEFL